MGSVLSNGCFILGNLQRITISEVLENDWFKKGYQPPSFETANVNLDDVDALFNESEASL